MSKKLLYRILSAVFMLFMIAALIPATPTMADDNDELGLPEFPVLKSKDIVLMDADSGAVLYQQNADKKCYPASTTKILTALLTIENLPLSDTVTYSQAAVDSIEYGDANASIAVGEELTVEQSLYCLILRSANEVAYGLAEAVGGTVSNFATIMNDRAAALGAVNTHFTNPSGLTDEFHYTTPYDMAMIARGCFNNKTLMNIMSYSELYTIAPTNKSNFTRYYRHRYQMLPGGDYAYKYSLGGKTGYTDASGYCLVSFAQKDGLRLICVVMDSTDKDRYNDTTALFDYYLNNYQKIYLSEYGSGVSSGSTDVLNLTKSLETSDSTSIGFADGAYLLVPESVTMSELTGIVTYADDLAYMGDAGGFACISYYYGSIDVGKATIYITSTGIGGADGSNGVPPVQRSLRTDEKVFFINVWILIGGFALTGFIVFGIIYFTRQHRRRTSYGSKKLRF